MKIQIGARQVKVGDKLYTAANVTRTVDSISMKLNGKKQVTSICYFFEEDGCAIAAPSDNIWIER